MIASVDANEGDGNLRASRLALCGAHESASAFTLEETRRFSGERVYYLVAPVWIFRCDGVAYGPVCAMKKLLADGSILIPSNFPRTRQGPDSRGYRICVAEIGRSCALMQGYVTFTDGSAYVYTAPSNAEFEALCASLQRGRQFNFQVRRANGGFVRGFVPPPDYEAIYDYPPYPGTTPTACPIGGADWDLTAWTITARAPGLGQTFVFVPDPGVSLSETFTLSVTVNLASGTASGQGSLTYNGPAIDCVINVAADGASGQFEIDSNVTVFQDGVQLANNDFEQSDTQTDQLPFSLADTGGADSTILITVDWLCFALTGAGDFSVTLSGQNV